MVFFTRNKVNFYLVLLFYLVNSQLLQFSLMSVKANEYNFETPLKFQNDAQGCRDAPVGKHCIGNEMFALINDFLPATDTQIFLCCSNTAIIEKYFLQLPVF